MIDHTCHEDRRRDDHSAIRVGSGTCHVCGESAEYYLAKRGDSLRENYCSTCGATRATRDLARVVLDTIGLDGNRSLFEQREALAGLCMLVMPAMGRIHSVVVGSTDRESPTPPLAKTPEQTAASIPPSNLFPLLYPDNHFDLVITEDLLQWVDDPLTALLEIARVIKPKGYHIFTVTVDEEGKLRPGLNQAAGRINRHRPSHDRSDADPAHTNEVVSTDSGTELSAVVLDSGMNFEVAAFTRFYPPGAMQRTAEEGIGRSGAETPDWHHYKNSIVFRSQKNGRKNNCTKVERDGLAVEKPARKEVILHIGTPKTATSYLQSFFAKNVQELSLNGIYYPAMINIEDAAAGVATSGNAFNLARSLLDEKDARKIRGPAAEDAWCRFERVLDDSPRPKILLSSEYFYIAPKEAYERIKKACEQRGYRCRVIVYLRRQDHFLQSQYTQYVKKGAGNLTAEQFCREHSNLGVFQYLKRLNRIADVIGVENCMVRAYEEGQFKGGSIGADMLDGLGVVNASGFVLSKSLINQSPSPCELEIIRYINANNPKPSGQLSLVLISALQQIQIEDSDSNKKLISPMLRHQIVDQFERENREIARRFLGRADGQLFNEPMPAPSPSWEAPRPLPDSPEVRLLARMTVVLCNEILGLKRHLGSKPGVSN